MEICKPKIYSFDEDIENPVYKEILDLIPEEDIEASAQYIPKDPEHQIAFLEELKRSRSFQEEYKTKQSKKQRVETRLSTTEPSKSHVRQSTEIDPERIKAMEGLHRLSNFHLGEEPVQSNESSTAFPSSSHLFDKTTASKYENIGAGFSDVTIDTGSVYMKTDDLDAPVTRRYPLIRKDGSPADGDDESYYGLQWVKQFLHAQEQLQKNKDYQFLYVLAGATNTVVDRLYTVDDIETRQIRAKIVTEQKLQDIKTNVTKIENLNTEIQNIEKEKLRLELQLERINFDKSTALEIRKLYGEIEYQRIYFIKYYALYSFSKDIVVKFDEFFTKDDMGSILLKDGTTQQDILEFITSLQYLFGGWSANHPTFDVGDYKKNDNYIEQGDENSLLLKRPRATPTNPDRQYTTKYLQKTSSTIYEGLRSAYKTIDESATDTNVLANMMIYIYSVFYANSIMIDEYNVESTSMGRIDTIFLYVENYLLTNSNIRTVLRNVLTPKPPTKYDAQISVIKIIRKIADFYETKYKSTINTISDKLSTIFNLIKQDREEYKKLNQQNIKEYEIISKIAKMKSADTSEKVLQDFFTSSFYMFVINVSKEFGVDMSVYDDSKKKIRDYQEKLLKMNQERTFFMNNLSKDDPDIPYRHEASWVLRPEFTGKITMEPIVRDAINQAYSDTLRKYMPHLSTARGLTEDAKRTDELEKLMHHPDYQPHFVLLVAAHMLGTRQRFQTRWTPDLSQERIRMIDSALSSLEDITGIPRQFKSRGRYRQRSYKNTLADISHKVGI